MQMYSRAPLRLFIPAVLVTAAYLSRPYVDDLGGDARVLLANLPYLLCVVAMFMAYQFNRCRLMLASVGVAAFYWVVQTRLQVSLDHPEAYRVYLGISLALPVTALYLLLLPERGVWNLHGLAFSIAFIVLVFAAMLLGPWLSAVNETAGGYYAPRPAEGYVLSYGVTLLAAFVGLVGLALLFLRSDEADLALLGTLGALYLVLALLHLEHISVTMCTAAGLCLVWGLLRSSHAMAYRDELTGLPGRRALNERIKMLGSRYSIAMLDIDHFKRFNDTYGHDVGDEVLRLVASRIRGVGGGGRAYRYGGEEFCIVFPRKSLGDCIEPLEAVRQEIADYRMSLRDQNLRPSRAREGSKRRGATRLRKSEVTVTVSAGLAARSEDFVDAEAVIGEADKQLYRAKRKGRNCIAY